MTRQETVKLFFAISSLYPKEQAFIIKDDPRGNAMIDMWHSMLGDIAFDVASSALKVHATKSPFPPSIAEMRQVAAAITNPDTAMTEDEAWQYVSGVLRKYGYYQPTKAKNSMPPEIWKLVQSIGYEALCLATFDTMPVLRGQFCRLWRTASERKKQDAALPEGLKQAIARIGMSDLKLVEGGAK